MELREIMIKEVKEGVITILPQKEIISKEAEIFKIKKEKLQTSLEGLSGRFVLAEKRISDFEDRLIEIMQAEKQREKRIEKNKEHLREMWNIFKHTNVHIMEVSDGERERNRKNIRRNSD